MLIRPVAPLPLPNRRTRCGPLPSRILSVSSRPCASQRPLLLPLPSRVVTSPNAPAIRVSPPRAARTAEQAAAPERRRHLLRLVRGVRLLRSVLGAVAVPQRHRRAQLVALYRARLGLVRALDPQRVPYAYAYGKR